MVIFVKIFYQVKLHIFHILLKFGADSLHVVKVMSNQSLESSLKASSHDSISRIRFLVPKIGHRRSDGPILSVPFIFQEVYRMKIDHVLFPSIFVETKDPCVGRSFSLNGPLGWYSHVQALYITIENVQTSLAGNSPIADVNALELGCEPYHTTGCLKRYTTLIKHNLKSITLINNV